MVQRRWSAVALLLLFAVVAAIDTELHAALERSARLGEVDSAIRALEDKVADAAQDLNNRLLEMVKELESDAGSVLYRAKQLSDTLDRRELAMKELVTATQAAASSPVWAELWPLAALAVALVAGTACLIRSSRSTAKRRSFMLPTRNGFNYRV